MENKMVKNNNVHLCDSCEYCYPECDAKYDDVFFGDGFTNDNICCCNKYKPQSVQEIEFEPPSREYIANNPDRPIVLYALEDKVTHRILFNARGGCYKSYDKARIKLISLGFERYEIVEYVMKGNRRGV